jgi:hypothetical protein
VTLRVAWGMLVVLSDPERAGLVERLARLEAALAERGARIEVLMRRVAELQALLCKDSRTSPRPHAPRVSRVQVGVGHTGGAVVAGSMRFVMCT